MILFNSKDYFKTTILNLDGKRFNIERLGKGSWTRAYKIKNTNRVILASDKSDTTKDAMINLKNKYIPAMKYLGEVNLPGSRLYKKVYETKFYNINREEWTKESNDIYDEIQHAIGGRYAADIDNFLLTLAIAKIPLRIKNALTLLYNATIAHAIGDVGWDFGYGNVAEDERGNIIFLDIFYDEGESF